MLALLLALILGLLPISDADVVAAIRAARGDALPLNPTLQAVADARAVQIVSDFSHYGPGADAARAPLAGWRWGEVLVWNDYPDELTLAAAMQQWMASPGHAGIITGSWAAFGAAVAVGPTGAHYYVAIFGIPPIPLRPSVPVRQAIPTLPPTDTGP